jgi:hypothetical protein
MAGFDLEQSKNPTLTKQRGLPPSIHIRRDKRKVQFPSLTTSTPTRPGMVFEQLEPPLESVLWGHSRTDVTHLSP